MTQPDLTTNLTTNLTTDLTTDLTKPYAPPDRVKIYLRNLLNILKGHHHGKSI